MRLAELMADPGLRLRPLAGDFSADPQVSWVHTTDLRDPRRYLSGGEVVLTGMLWYHEPADATAFVAALAQAGVVAVGLGTAELATPEALRAVTEACREHGVRAFEVPLDVSFMTIAQRVSAEDARRSSALLDHHRRLVAAVAVGGGLDGLLAAGAAELGADCWVITPTGRVVAGPATPHAARLAARFLTAPRLPARHAEPRCTLLAAGSGPRLAAWILVVAGDHEDWPAELHEVAAELATLVGLERSALAAGRVTERRTAGQLLRLATGEAAPAAEIAARLVAAGFGAREQVRAVSAVLTGEGAPAVPVLEEVLPGRCVVTEVDGEAFGLVADREGLLEEVRDAVGLLAAGLGTSRFELGVSGPVDATRLRAAVEEARYARGVAGHRGTQAAVVAGSELASHEVLFGALPDELRRSFSARLLGPVLDYDRTHQSALLDTLRVFLDCSGSWTQAANQLHLHVNTLRYRIGRVEELTGRDLTRFADRVDLYLALRLA
ncbi:PucR family transcriptional regulator [Kutzneria albida]|uniref:PucR family transcription regulator n=1 Tax=Kutzneria albida DSM 43870 TaxID=1449976 RepID=W5WI81_9PSEU|nr:PucR family transcriptional regulator [Kutzneria albida]AHH97869.1 hypothetical protein KALB_4507 [Kutzneria albida DSM 43870]